MGTIRKGYALDDEQEHILRAHGLKARDIYREDLPREAFGRWTLRKGETLCIAGGLHVVSDDRKTLRAFVDKVQSWGAEVEDVITGMRTDEKGLQMLDDALTRARGEKTIGSPDQARAMQLSAAAKRKENRLKNRMGKREAMAIWRNPELKTREALAQMTGWSLRDAYKELKGRGVPTGRRPKS